MWWWWFGVVFLWKNHMGVTSSIENNNEMQMLLLLLMMKFKVAEMTIKLVTKGISPKDFSSSSFSQPATKRDVT